ncbi:uncharacterized protein PHALS_10508 [Plasmopara halstedii]|uniref:Uncharacterized protein n=1 Tax=Plasmopara halstedii TaxID=4781 RepID=A0A0P1AGU6_PLAHL|nr:uncharacterized protein PHALS_10508 [Plasmopara halstedii]CEG40300.1 hypothetical protein PHALS_10508 [Plasmopara halstedii]|eukprot:XP_024576669.1 hypothetical protein PHALS_10508 [Plasmopara halstedii]
MTRAVERKDSPTGIVISPDDAPTSLDADFVALTKKYWTKRTYIDHASLCAASLQIGFFSSCTAFVDIKKHGNMSNLPSGFGL